MIPQSINRHTVVLQSRGSCIIMLLISFICHDTSVDKPTYCCIAESTYVYIIMLSISFICHDTSVDKPTYCCIAESTFVYIIMLSISFICHDTSVINRHTVVLQSRGSCIIMLLISFIYHDTSVDKPTYCCIAESRFVYNCYRSLFYTMIPQSINRHCVVLQSRRSCRWTPRERRCDRTTIAASSYFGRYPRLLRWRWVQSLVTLARLVRVVVSHPGVCSLEFRI